MGPLDRFTFCRLCLCKSASLMDIFDETNVEGYVVKETMEDLLRFKVVQVPGCPWLTCDSCREKLHDFRRFKINCIESKVAFENRFPQQIILMPGGISISTNSTGKSHAVLLLPVSSMPNPVGNVNPFPMAPPSFPSPHCNQFITCGDGANISKPYFGVDMACGENENHLMPKIEPIEAEPDISSIYEMDSQRQEQMDSVEPSAEDVESEIEEMDVKNVLMQENCMEPIMACEEDENWSYNAGKIMGSCSKPMNQEITDLADSTENNHALGEMSSLPIITSVGSLAPLSKRGKLYQLLRVDRNSISSCPDPPPLIYRVPSVSYRNHMNGQGAIITPFHEQGRADPPKVDSDLNGDLICDSSTSTASVLELPVSSSEESSFPSNTLVDSHATILSNCNAKIVKDVVLGQYVKSDGDQDGAESKTTLQCVMCHEIYSRSNLMEKIKHAHHGDPRPYKCWVCPRTYKNRKNQTMHIINHYNVPNRFECEICNLGFRFRHYLNLHKRSHKVKDNYPCKICGQVFKNSHLRARHHARHSGPQHACPHCDKTYFLKGDLTVHMMNHNTDRTFVCKVCGKGFTKQTYLRCHEQLHDEVKRHECKECGAKFAQYSSLWQHKKWHQGNKKFVCDVCGKGYVLNCQLRQHQKIHLKASTRRGRKAKSKKGNNAVEEPETENNAVDGPTEGGATKSDGATKTNGAEDSVMEEVAAKYDTKGDGQTIDCSTENGATKHSETIDSLMGNGVTIDSVTKEGEVEAGVMENGAMEQNATVDDVTQGSASKPNAKENSATVDGVTEDEASECNVTIEKNSSSEYGATKDCTSPDSTKIVSSVGNNVAKLNEQQVVS